MLHDTQDLSLIICIYDPDPMRNMQDDLFWAFNWIVKEWDIFDMNEKNIFRILFIIILFSYFWRFFFKSMRFSYNYVTCTFYVFTQKFWERMSKNIYKVQRKWLIIMI